MQVGYFIVICPLLIKINQNVKVIYHDTMLSMRLEKNKLIKTITFFSEKLIYKNVIYQL